MKKQKRFSPDSGEKILKYVMPGDEAESIAGDYEIIFQELVEKKSLIYARFWYWWQIIKTVGRTLYVSVFWSLIMFRNYFKIAWRNIQKHKGYSIINISGLALGLACCLLILLWVRDETSYDKFHENVPNLYRVIQERSSVTCAPMAPALEAEVPEIVKATRYRPIGTRLIKYKDKAFNGDRFSLVDPAYFEMFTFPFLKGDPSQALKDPFTIVLTEKTAQKFFGDEEPVGKTLRVEDRFDFKVTGIIKNVPHNSHMQFDVLSRFDFLQDLWGEDMNNWRSSSHITYVQLQDGSNHEEVVKKMCNVYKKYAGDDYKKLLLYPLIGIHLSRRVMWVDSEPGSIVYVYMFSVIALFILVIACINFMNLMTARSVKRAKEVGIRKVVGAQKLDLVRQFYGESAFSLLISFLIAFILVVLLLPAFNNLAGKQLTIALFRNMNIASGMVLIAVFAGILSASYPALFISSFRPAKVLKTLSTNGIKGSFSLVKMMVIIQFVITIFLIICTIVVYRQLNFIQNRDLGYDRENIICMPVTNSFLRQLSAASNELISYPNIVSIALSSTLPGRGESTTSKITWDGKNTEEKVVFEVIWADMGFLETFKLTIREGRFFSREFISDLRNGVVINETAARIMGFDNESAIGKRLYNAPGRSSLQGGGVNITGVMKDFHSRSLHYEIAPVIIRYPTYPQDNLSIRIRAGKLNETLNFLAGIWQKFVPDYPFTYIFFDEIINDLYSAEQRMGKIFNYFSYLAIFISCLGLLGLTAFTAEKRTKEVGIRKVFGASTPHVVLMLTKEFLLLVVLAIFVSWPVSYYVAHRWLQKFAYRSDLPFWIFPIAGVFCLLIVLLTVSYQVIKAAYANPIESLRYE